MPIVAAQKMTSKKGSIIQKKGRDADKQGQKGTVFRFPIGCQHGLTRVGGW